MDDFASLFAADAHFVNVVGVWWKDRNEIKAAHAATHQTMFKDSRLSGEVSSRREVAPGVIAVHVTWILTGAIAPDGSPAGDREGILLLILTNEQSGWRIKLAQNTDILRGAIAPPARGDKS